MCFSLSRSCSEVLTVLCLRTSHLKGSLSMTVVKHCPLLVGRCCASAAAFKAVGLFGCLTPCLLNIIMTYRQTVCEIFPDAGNQMSIAGKHDCLPTFSEGFADLIKPSWGDNLRLDLVISNIITTGKSVVVEPRPHGNTEEQEDGKAA